MGGGECDVTVVIDIIITLITCFMIVGITFLGYSWLTVRRSTNMQYYLLSVRKDEMLDEERNIQRFAKSFADMSCSVNEATEALKKLQMTVTQENINTYLIEQVGGTSTSTSIRKPKSTNCPNCGAPVDIHAEKCAYCDTPYI